MLWLRCCLCLIKWELALESSELRYVWNSQRKADICLCWDDIVFHTFILHSFFLLLNPPVKCLITKVIPPSSRLADDDSISLSLINYVICSRNNFLYKNYHRKIIPSVTDIKNSNTTTCVWTFEEFVWRCARKRREGSDTYIHILSWILLFRSCFKINFEFHNTIQCYTLNIYCVVNYELK